MTMMIAMLNNPNLSKTGYRSQKTSDRTSSQERVQSQQKHTTGAPQLVTKRFQTPMEISAPSSKPHEEFRLQYINIRSFNRKKPYVSTKTAT